MEDTPSRISASRVRQLVRMYPDFVPETLSSLENARLVSIPASLQERTSQGDVFLTKPEVTTLVEWKLKHGTFRPTLLSLVKANPDHVVEATTRDAFKQLFEQESQKAQKHESLLCSFAALNSLKGIGPATASLLLSEHSPGTIPFFSDELYRWAVCYEADHGQAKWLKVVIRYTMASYMDLFKAVEDTLDRLNHGAGQSDAISALDLEKAAYALARFAALDAASEKTSNRGRRKRSAQSLDEQAAPATREPPADELDAEAERPTGKIATTKSAASKSGTRATAKKTAQEAAPKPLPTPVVDSETEARVAETRSKRTKR